MKREIDYILESEYPEEYSSIKEGFKARKCSFRVNTLKGTKEEIIKYLTQKNISYEEVSWYKDAFIIDNKEDMSASSLFSEGKIYLQSLSSMLPPLFMDLKENTTILDMTASPGSKTTQIAALTQNKAMITALEKNKIRAEKLKYNVEKQGAKKVQVLQMDARKLEEYFLFDEILLDAPCSGSGTLIGEDNNWSLELLSRSQKFQRELLESASKHIKVGGSILYSTCSILREENELQIEEFLKYHPNFILEPLSKEKDLPYLQEKLEGTLLIKPTAYFEGFFLAKLRKVQ